MSFGSKVAVLVTRMEWTWVAIAYNNVDGWFAVLGYLGSYLSLET